MTFKRIFLFLLVLLSTSFSYGIEFRLLGAQSKVDGWYYLDDDGREVPLLIRPDYLAGWQYHHRDKSDLLLYRNVSVEQVIQREIVMRIPFKDTESELIFIVSEAESNSAALHLRLDDSFENVPAGSLRVCNLSPRSVAFQIAGKSVLIEENESYTHVRTSDSRVISLRAASRNSGGEWEIFHSMPIPLSGDKRALVIVREVDDDDGKPDVGLRLDVVYDGLIPSS